MPDKKRVMIINDSRTMLRVLGDMIESSERFEVCCTAQDGIQASRMLRDTSPDAVVLDLEMPRMDGLTFIAKTMRESPVPIVVVSSYAQQGAQMTLDALERGAVDFVQIPLEDDDGTPRFREDLIAKISVAVETDPDRILRANFSRARKGRAKFVPDGGTASRLVVIGGSTGAIPVVRRILSELPAEIPAGILVAQHMPEGFTRALAQSLGDITELEVKEATGGEEVKRGMAILAPGNYHMLVEPTRTLRISQAAKRLGVRPSVNMLMVSASEAYGPNVVGVLLSGMGEDGAFGMKAIKRRGGVTLAQNEESSVVFGMARAARDLGGVDRLVPAEKLPGAILEAVAK